MYELTPTRLLKQCGKTVNLYKAMEQADLKFCLNDTIHSDNVMTRILHMWLASDTWQVTHWWQRKANRTEVIHSCVVEYLTAIDQCICGSCCPPNCGAVSVFSNVHSRSNWRISSVKCTTALGARKVVLTKNTQHLLLPGCRHWGIFVYE